MRSRNDQANRHVHVDLLTSTICLCSQRDAKACHRRANGKLQHFKAEAEIELDHWWFAGRRRLFAREIARQGIGTLSRVLDVGTSTGTNLRMLRDAEFTNVVGVDPSEYALKTMHRQRVSDRSSKRYSTPAVRRRTGFDLVLATDVIEHVDDDRAAIREIARILDPGAWC